MMEYLKVDKDGTVTKEPVPEFLEGLAPEALLDLSWTDPALGVQEAAWWPAEDASPPLKSLEEYGDPTYSPDPDRKVVVVTKAIIPPPREKVDKLKASLMAGIDDKVEERIKKSTRFSLAYQQREAAARAFKEAGYTGPADEWITRFAGNTGMSNRAAADLILAQADGLRAALKELDNLRMDKYLVMAAATPADARRKQAEILEQINAVVIP